MHRKLLPSCPIKNTTTPDCFFVVGFSFNGLALIMTDLELESLHGWNVKSAYREYKWRHGVLVFYPWQRQHLLFTWVPHVGIACTKDDSDDEDDQTEVGDDKCCLTVWQKGYHCSSIVPQHINFPNKTLTETALSETTCKEIQTK